MKSNLALSTTSALAATAAGLLHAAPHRAEASVGSPQVVAVVKVAKPWYAPRFLLVRKFRETVPEYEAIPGLQFKYYTLSDDAQFGGIYLWRDLASAKRWFNESWFARVLQQRGAPANVRFFDAPVLVDNVPAGTAAASDGRAVATVVTLPVPPGASREQLIAGFQKSIPVYRQVPGLLRKYYILTSDGKFGGVYLWADRESARRHFDLAWRETARAKYGADPVVETLDAPLVTPSRLPENRVMLAQP